MNAHTPDHLEGGADLESWIDQEMSHTLGGFLAATPPKAAWANPTGSSRWGLRLASGGAGTALALAGCVMAAAMGVAAATGNSTAAQNCALSPAPIHGTCTSTAAQTLASSSASASATAEPSDSASADSNAHGVAVSTAAHNCPTGPGGVHGKCVSAVAQGNATPPATPQTPVAAGSASAGHGNSGGHTHP